ncbi:MAG TPA: NACHT domain-containing NTPase [Candidatus Sericytochromatia bacterium]
MKKRSLQASLQGIEQAKKSIIHNCLTQRSLAKELGITRQPVGKFFRGKPVDRNLFVQICDRLDLEWEEVIAEPPNDLKLVEEDQNLYLDIEALVQEVREKVKVTTQQRCGTMRVLDMTQPIGLGDIYTDVNILKKITGRRRLEIADLLKGFDPELDNFDRCGLGRVTEKRASGLEVVKDYPKLMILGKPGSGKTTFLKYLAIQCSSGDFLDNLVPIFITLRDFAEAKNQPSCLEFIAQLLSNVGVTETQTTKVIEQGRALILLDGLDEIKEEDASWLIKEIQHFSDQYYTNQFIVTCRIAAREYTFEKFTEVEVTDFNSKQIKAFANKWFQAKESDTAERFLQQLQSNLPIKELATNPLLLTLLCIEFEDAGDFPADRAELYKRGITTLLRKWDAKRGIVRDTIYKKLSVQRKKDLLSQIALITFERKDYFFKQRDVERYIAEYIRNLPDAQTDPEGLQFDSEVVLKSIEAQHGLLVERARGIYSFSHLTFQEYFTVRKIVTGADPQALEKALQNLVCHITETRWREVFLLAVGMLQPADYLLQLIKQQADAFVAGDEQLQKFLTWVNEKSLLVEVPYKSAAVRAFYINLTLDDHSPGESAHDRYSELIRALDNQLYMLVMLGSLRALEVGLDDTLVLAYNRALELDESHSPYAFKGAFLLACERAANLEPKLGQALQELKEQLPDLNGDEWKFKQWWQGHGRVWTEQLREVMIQYRNVGHDWEFSQQQKEVLKQYYNANLVLVDCLNSDCYVNREVRSQIEKTLLLPVADIERCQ